MVHVIIDLLFHPDEFFTRINREPPDFVIPLIIVGSGCLFSVLFPFLAIALSPGNVIAYSFTDAWVLFSPFIAWVLITLGLFGFCRAFAGTGTFQATLCNVGYGMLPLTLFSVLTFITGLFLTSAVKIPMSLIPISLGLFILNIVFIAWSGYLWMHAIEKTHAIPRRNAMTAAAIIAGFYFLWPFVPFILAASPVLTPMIRHLR